MANSVIRDFIYRVKTVGLAQAEKEFLSAEKAANSYKNSASKVDRANKSLANSATNNTKEFSKQAQGLGGLVHVYATVAANVFALTSAFVVLKDAADLKILTKSADALGASIGVNFSFVASKMKEVTLGALSMGDALRLTNLGVSGGATTQQLTAISDIATRAATALGRSVPDAVNRMIQAVVKGEPELVDEFGIILRLEEANRKYALSLNKTVKELSTYEKQQAIINQLLEQGQKKFENVPKIANPFQQAATSFIETAKEVVGVLSSLFGPVISTIAESGTAILTVMGLLVAYIGGKVLPLFTDFGQKILSVFDGMEIAAKDTFQSIERQLAGTAKGMEVVKRQLLKQREEIFAAAVDSIRLANKSINLDNLFAKGGISDLLASELGDEKIYKTFRKKMTDVIKQIKVELAKATSSAGGTLTLAGTGGKTLKLTRKEAEDLLDIFNETTDALNEVRVGSDAYRKAVADTGVQLNIVTKKAAEGKLAIAAFGQSIGAMVTKMQETRTIRGDLAVVIDTVKSVGQSLTQVNPLFRFTAQGATLLAGGLTLLITNFGAIAGGILGFIFSLELLGSLTDKIGITSTALEGLSENLEAAGTLAQTAEEAFQKFNKVPRLFSEAVDNFSLQSNAFGQVADGITKISEAVQQLNKATIADRIVNFAKGGVDTQDLGIELANLIGAAATSRGAKDRLQAEFEKAGVLNLKTTSAVREIEQGVVGDLEASVSRLVDLSNITIREAINLKDVLSKENLNKILLVVKGFQDSSANFASNIRVFSDNITRVDKAFKDTIFGAGNKSNLITGALNVTQDFVEDLKRIEDSAKKTGVDVNTQLVGMFNGLSSETLKFFEIVPDAFSDKTGTEVQQFIDKVKAKYQELIDINNTIQRSEKDRIILATSLEEKKSEIAKGNYYQTIDSFDIQAKMLKLQKDSLTAEIRFLQNNLNNGEKLSDRLAVMNQIAVKSAEIAELDRQAKEFTDDKALAELQVLVTTRNADLASADLDKIKEQTSGLQDQLNMRALINVSGITNLKYLKQLIESQNEFNEASINSLVLERDKLLSLRAQASINKDIAKEQDYSNKLSLNTLAIYREQLRIRKDKVDSFKEQHEIIKESVGLVNNYNSEIFRQTLGNEFRIILQEFEEGLAASGNSITRIAKAVTTAMDTATDAMVDKLIEGGIDIEEAVKAALRQTLGDFIKENLRHFNRFLLANASSTERGFATGAALVEAAIVAGANYHASIIASSNMQSSSLHSAGLANFLRTGPGYTPDDTFFAGGATPFATGGIAQMPTSGGAAVLHGTEAVVPLPNNKKIPVQLKGEKSNEINVNQSFNFGNATEETVAELKKNADRIKKETIAELLRRIDSNTSISRKVGRR